MTADPHRDRTPPVDDRAEYNCAEYISRGAFEYGLTGLVSALKNDLTNTDAGLP